MPLRDPGPGVRPDRGAALPAGRAPIVRAPLPLRCLLLALLALLALLPDGGLRAQEGTRTRPEVTEVIFRGVQAVDEDELRASIATTASECAALIYRLICPFVEGGTFWNRAYLDRLELRRDVLRIQAFYWLRGYRNARVDTLVLGEDREDPDEPGNEVAVAFGVAEGEPLVVREIAITGIDSLAGAIDRDRVLRLQEGEPYNLIMLDSTVLGLRNALWELGYADAVVDTVVRIDTAARSVAIELPVVPRWRAEVGRIEVVGLEGLSESAVRRRLLLEEGDVFRRSALIESQRALYESGLFRRATITPEGDSVKALLIAVEVAELQSTELRGGFSTVDFFQTGVTYVHRQFLDRPQQLRASLNVGNLLADQLEEQFIFTTLPFPAAFTGDRTPFLRPTFQAGVDLTRFAVGSPRNTLAVGAFANRRVSPGIVIERTYGASAAFTRRLTLEWPVTLGYRYEITQIEAGSLYFCVNFNVCDPVTVFALNENASLSPLELVAATQRWNDPLDPTDGWTLRASAEHASAATLSDFTYNRATADATWYRPLGGAGVLAVRGRVGVVSPIGSGNRLSGAADLLGRPVVHPRKAFFSGGSRSVRGYGENLLGPKILTVAPEVLEAVGCDPVIFTCPAGALDRPTPGVGGALGDTAFVPRPLGARALIEASLEYRFPLAGPVSGAAFVDGAMLGNTFAETFDGSNAALTPGFGIRYASPVGPIRIDVGLNPQLVESLPVLTSTVVEGERQIIPVIGPDGELLRRRFSSVGSGVLGRAVLHLSIGQAF